MRYLGDRLVEKLSHTGADWKPEGDGTKVGIFMPLPSSIDNQFPELEKDASPAHITFLVIGEVPAEQRDAVRTLVEDSLEAVPGPVRVTASKLGHFTNKKGQVIAHLVPEFSEDLEEARRRIIAGVEKLGIEVEDYGKDAWKPHITLGYLDAGKEWEGDVPDVEWSAAEMEIWGLPTLVTIPFGTSGSTKEALSAHDALRDLSVKLSARAGVRQLRALVEQGDNEGFQRLVEMLDNAGALKRTGPGTQIKHLGAGKEGLATLVVGAKDAPVGKPSVRKLYDTNSPFYSKDDMAARMQVQRKEKGNALFDTDFRLAEGYSPRIRRTEKGAPYLQNEYVPPSNLGTPFSFIVRENNNASGIHPVHKPFHVGDMHGGNYVNTDKDVVGIDYIARNKKLVELENLRHEANQPGLGRLQAESDKAEKAVDWDSPGVMSTPEWANYRALESKYHNLQRTRQRLTDKRYENFDVDPKQLIQRLRGSYAQDVAPPVTPNPRLPKDIDADAPSPLRLLGMGALGVGGVGGLGYAGHRYLGRRGESQMKASALRMLTKRSNNDWMPGDIVIRSTGKVPRMKDVGVVNQQLLRLYRAGSPILQGEAAHVGIIGPNGEVIDTIAGGHVRSSPVTDVLGDRAYKVVRPPVDEDIRREAAEIAASQLGTPYSSKDVTRVAGGLLLPRSVIRNLNKGRSEGPICSTLIADSYERAGANLVGVPTHWAAPSDFLNDSFEEVAGSDPTTPLRRPLIGRNAVNHSRRDARREARRAARVG